MDGAEIIVNSNAQDGVTNTMNGGPSSFAATPATSSGTPCAAAPSSWRGSWATDVASTAGPAGTNSPRWASVHAKVTASEHQSGAEVAVEEVGEADREILEAIITQHCMAFEVDPGRFSPDEFLKLYPWSSQPYGKLYAY